MQFDFAMVLVFLLSAVGFSFVNLLVGRFLRPRFPSVVKGETYECGEESKGPAWVNFNPRFYVVALVFVIFEVEIALTIPVALAFRKWVYSGLGFVAVVEIFLFIAILSSGLVWLWLRRDLDWVKKLERAEVSR